jgi:hypothetical protein
MNVQYDCEQTDASWSGETDGEARVESSVETKLSPDAISLLHEELRTVTGSPKTITAERDVYEALFLKEWQGAAQQDSYKQSVNEAEIRLDKGSLVRQLGASSEQSDDLSSAGRCVRVEPMVITRGRHTFKHEKNLGQCKDGPVVRQELVNPVFLEADRDVAITEALPKQSELANLQAWYEEDVTRLQDQLQTLKTQCDLFIRERHVLIHRAQRAYEKLEAMKMTEALKTENCQGQCKDSALLGKQLKGLKAELSKITKERNAYILKVQRMSRNKAEIQSERDALRREAENCRCQCKDVAVLEKKVNAD